MVGYPVFVISLRNLIRYMRYDLSITVTLGKSFPLNVKGEDLDEFGYVLFTVWWSSIIDMVKSELIHSKDSCYKHTTLLMFPFESQFFSQSWPCHAFQSICNNSRISSQIKFPLNIIWAFYFCKCESELEL